MAQARREPPAFMSTHPQNQDRQARLQGHMDEVIFCRRGVDLGFGAGCGGRMWKYIRRFLEAYARWDVVIFRGYFGVEKS